MLRRMLIKNMPKQIKFVPISGKRFLSSNALMVLPNQNENKQDKRSNTHFKILATLGCMGAFGAGYVWQNRQEKIEAQKELERKLFEKNQERALKFQQLLVELKTCKNAVEFEAVLSKKNLNVVINNITQLASVIHVVFNPKSKIHDAKDREYLFGIFSELLTNHIKTKKDLNEICNVLISSDKIHRLLPLIKNNITTLLDNFVDYQDFMLSCKISSKNKLIAFQAAFPEEYFNKIVFEDSISSLTPLARLISLNRTRYLHDLSCVGDYGYDCSHEPFHNYFDLFQKSISKFSNEQLIQLCNDSTISATYTWETKYCRLLFQHSINQFTDTQLKAICNSPDNLEKVLFHIEKRKEVVKRLGDEHIRELKIDQILPLRRAEILKLLPNEMAKIILTDVEVCKSRNNIC